VIFGLFHLLGYQFSPRLADVGESRFWRMDASADYGVLNGLARQTINRNLIEQNWDDLLRVAGSLKLGIVNVTELLRALRTWKKHRTFSLSSNLQACQAENALASHSLSVVFRSVNDIVGEFKKWGNMTLKQAIFLF
jgi:hypothetical protein